MRYITEITVLILGSFLFIGCNSNICNKESIDETLLIYLVMDYTKNRQRYRLNNESLVLYKIPSAENLNENPIALRTKKSDINWMINYCDNLYREFCDEEKISYKTNNKLIPYPAKVAYISITKGDPLDQSNCSIDYSFNTENEYVHNRLDSLLAVFYERVELIID